MIYLQMKKKYMQLWSLSRFACIQFVISSVTAPAGDQPQPATASLSFAEAAAALKHFAVSILPGGTVALRPRDTVELKLSFR